MIFIIIFTSLIVLAIIIEGASLSVYGKPISDRELIPYLERNLNQYEINNFAFESGSKMLSSYRSELPFIAQTKTILFCWNIEDYGLITRWSKASKMINKCFDGLPKPPLRKKLKDL